MNNMGYIIFSHNKQCLQLCNKNYGCNCRKNETCPLDNKCLTRNTIYKAQITNNTKNEHKKYLGATQTSFKERCNNHTRDINHKNYMKCTKLPKYVSIL